MARDFHKMAKFILVGGDLWADINSMSEKCRTELMKAILEVAKQKGLIIEDGEFPSVTGEGIQAHEQGRMQFEDDEGEGH